MGFLGSLFGGGKRFGRVSIERRFRMVAPLGAGTMSKVWQAIDLQSGREICLKLLDIAQLKQLKQRFAGLKRPDEGEVAIQLKHPNIVKTYEHGLSTKGQEYIVMEYIRGTGLILLAETRSRELQGRELDYLIQAGDALAYMHEAGFIHRDVCPHNVIITPERVAKLIDFGLAVPNRPEFCRPGNRTGKVSYMAPELIRRLSTDVRVDVFAFAVTCYQTMTGKLPWEAAQSLQSMLQHINEPPRDPREINPDVDEDTAMVLLKGLERNPKDRYETMKVFVDELRRLRGDELPEESA